MSHDIPLTLTVYCDEASHENGAWERDYVRMPGDDGRWRPDIFDRIGGKQKRARRAGGERWIDAAGRVVPTWDHGPVTRTKMLDDAAARLLGALDGARSVAGVGEVEPTPLAQQYALKCPECGMAINYNGAKFTADLNRLAEHGFTRLPLSTLLKMAHGKL